MLIAIFLFIILVAVITEWVWVNFYYYLAGGILAIIIFYAIKDKLESREGK